MNYDEMEDEAAKVPINQYIKDCWAGNQDAELSALSRITNYLFVLNSGALLASIAYVATKPYTAGLMISIWLFALGALLICLHAAIDYYELKDQFIAFRKDVERFYQNQLGWQEFMEQERRREGKSDQHLHILGWLSGLLFVAGLINGIWHI